MLLGCCICDRPAATGGSSSGGSTGGDGSSGDASAFSGSVSSALSCTSCAGGVLPARLKITWPYTGTGDANHPCCGNYDSIGPITVYFQSVTVLGNEVRCSYESTDTLFQSVKPPFFPRRCDPSLNPICEFYFFKFNGPDVSARARIRYAEDVVGGQDCIYQQVIGQAPFSCLQSFTLTKLSDWGVNGPCVSESIPGSVAVSPA
jgi:hypothetical protein